MKGLSILTFLPLILGAISILVAIVLFPSFREFITDIASLTVRVFSFISSSIKLATKLSTIFPELSIIFFLFVIPLIIAIIVKLIK